MSRSNAAKKKRYSKTWKFLKVAVSNPVSQFFIERLKDVFSLCFKAIGYCAFMWIIIFFLRKMFPQIDITTIIDILSKIVDNVKN